MHLVIEPIPLILNLLVTFGKNHLAFAFSFAILNLSSVKTSLFVVLYSLIQLAAALLLSKLQVLLFLISLLDVILPYWFIY
jgi:hypothetical protein